MSTNIKLIKIGASKDDLAHNSSFPMSIVFFILGAVIGGLGSAWWGVYVWLILNGQITNSYNFILYKSLHSNSQFYYFLGFFIIGFLVQASAKMFGHKQKPITGAGTILILMLVSFFTYFIAHSVIPQIIIFSCFIYLTFYMLFYLQTINLKENLFALPLICCGLLSYGLSVFLKLYNPFDAIVLMWLGVIPIIFATSQQFITGFLSGRKLAYKQIIIFYFFYIPSAIMLLAFYFTPTNTTLWYFFVVFALLTSFWFICNTQLYLKLSDTYQDPMAIGFKSAYFWLVIANIFAFIRGPFFADSYLHLLGMGVASTLIIATSSRIIAFLSTNQINKDKILIFAIFVWQIVVFARSKIIDFPAQFSWIVGLLTIITFAIWFFIIAKYLRQLLLKRRALNLAS